MPYECKEQNGMHRLVDKDTGQVATEEGSPMDGGGHESAEACQSQAQTINNREYNSPANNPKGAKRLRNPKGRQ